MIFSDEEINISNPLYLLRFCLPDGSSPFLHQKWELDRKSVKDTSRGVYGVKFEESMYRTGIFAKGLADKENMLILLESSEEYIRHEFHGLVKAFTFANLAAIVTAVRSGISSEKALNIIEPTIPREMIQETAVSAANIIAVSKGGEFQEMENAAILNNILKGRNMYAGLTGILLRSQIQ